MACLCGARDVGLAAAREGVLVIPGEPVGGGLGDGVVITLKLGEVVEGILVVELGGVDQGHVDVADASAALAPIEERGFSKFDGHFESTLTNVVVEWGSWETEKDGKFVPPLEKVIEGISQARVGLDELVGELGRHPFLELVHDGSAVPLVGAQSLVAYDASFFAIVVDLVDEGEPVEEKEALKVYVNVAEG